MEYLTQQNRRCEGDAMPRRAIHHAPKDKHVIIIGGGDTGADCLGTAHRQGARSRCTSSSCCRGRPTTRAAEQSVAAVAEHLPRVVRARRRRRAPLLGVDRALHRRRDGRVTTLHAHTVEIAPANGRLEFTPVPGSEFELDADLVLLAMGFVGPERSGMLDQLGVRMTERGNVWRDANWMTSVPGVFTAGDMQRGQSLIVWAIAEGRSAARGVDHVPDGQSELPAPLS